ncbi:MAG TPA: enolase C-terminal domain-like protein [Phycisphaerae bacterium]|nr:enolase C-terminal domain-like protein [Phycisphaerae bacterium]
MADSVIRSVTIHQLAIPMRRKVTHAASQRALAEPIVVTVELQNGILGHGETLPRPYVTGETVDSAVAAIQRVFVPRLVEMHPIHFPGALEAIDALPMRDEVGTLIPAARAAVELAVLDAYSRYFSRPIHDASGWMGLAGFGRPGSTEQIRYSGVLASDTLASTLKTLRLLWWYGLRHFKLKVGLPDDAKRVAAVLKRIGRAIQRGQATLRVDANGAWTREQAIERLSDLRDLPEAHFDWLPADLDQPLAGIEQPLAKDADLELPLIHDLAAAPLIHDESLVTLDDAKRLHDLGVADGFNIRISKCGGLLPSLRLADFARRHHAIIQLGCMVGETSILSAAGRRFLEMVPGVAFAEGWFGSFLLSSDVTRRPLRFRYGGRGRDLPGPGLGVEVDPNRLAALDAQPPIVCNL